jgi:hypothetical protein
MADGFRLVPVEAEVAASDRQIRRNRQFLTPARGQKGAIVADAQTEAAVGSVCCPLANLGEQGEFASSAGSSKMGLFHSHLLRIG